MSRTLEELKLRASALLDSRVSQELRDKCVEIARTKSPSAAFDLAARAAFQAGLGQMEALGVAKATRWLAVVRRDHGDQVFEDAVKTLTTTTPTV